MLVLVSVAFRSNAAQLADSTELMQIYEADQKDRDAPPDRMDWKTVGLGMPPAGNACAS